VETVEEASPQQGPGKIKSVKKESPSVPRVNGVNMTISLDGLQSSIDPSTLFSRAYGNMKAYQAQAALHSPVPNGGHSSAPPTAHAYCPTCGRSVSDPIMLPGYADISPDSSPLVIPMGPLAAAAFESGMSAVEELKLLKAQVQDVARVCNAVARGDLSQKITVVVQGVVMVQLKDVINTMVYSFIFSFILVLNTTPRWTNWDNSQRKLLVYRRKSELKGKSNSFMIC
jgi:osomolarity two-component system sensor histidine kinase NIK1